MKSVTTKICKTLLLALLAALWSTNAWAGIKIYVRTEGNASGITPYLHAWNSSGDLTSWPGEVMPASTTTSDGVSWFVKEFDVDNLNIIISNNGNDQTSNIEGIQEDRYYVYKANNGEKYNLTNQYVIPDKATYVDDKKFVYFVNTSEWSTPHAHVYNNSGNITGIWPGEAMTKVQGSVNLWKWDKSTTETPASVIFNDGGSSQSSTLTFTNGGYYNTSDLITTISGIILNSTNFPDENLRAAITASTGVAEGNAITVNNVKILDISNHGITNTTGLAYFTNLEELYASNNDITFVDLQNATNLRILDLHQNENLLGFGVGDPGTSNHIVRLPSGCLQYINMSNTRLRNYTAQAFANKVAGTLETFIARDVYYTSDAAKFAFNSVPSVTTLTKLKYLDVSGCDGTPVTIIADLANMKSTLEYLDISNQHMTTNGLDPALDGFTALQTFKFNNQSTWSKSLSINNCPSLTYVDVSGNTAMTGLTINNCGITTLNFPEAATLSTLTHLATLNVSNNPFTVLNIPQTPNSLLTVTANDCSTMTGILAEHNKSKLQYVTAHNCPALTDITINGADIYFNKQLNAFDATNKSTLETLDLSNDAMTTNYALDGFTALQTVDFDNNYMDGNNNDLHSFTATNCPALTSVNLDGNANMETITLKSNRFDNRSYPVVTVDAEASNVTLDFSDNNFTAVPNIQASQINVLKLNSNQLTNINIPDGCNVNYLYAQSNNFGGGEYELLETSLVGLDLGNNGFTKFKMTGNTTLKSLALSGNDALTEIELHGNTQLTQTSPDGVIESDNGLYINNLANLEVLNIENSNFNKLGQGDALIGLPKLKKLQARKNKFTTFTNGVYELHTSTTNSVNYRKPDPTQSSLERLEALEYLDLAYNNLQDSVHLYRNTALKHLDVSYNRSIDGQPNPAAEPLAKNAEQKATILEQKGRRWMKYGKIKFNGVKKTYGVNASPEQWEEHYTNMQALRERPFDLRECDLNDTTGLYHLDLGKNVNLEWLDISYTNIHNTAAGPAFMCPGWMNEDWVTDNDFSAENAEGKNTDGRWYSSWHTFVYFIPCSKLKTLHMDHNNMQSMGVRYFPELETLTSSYMYGDCALMRDFNKTEAVTSYEDLRYGYGNTGLSGSVVKYTGDEYLTTNSEGIVTNFEGSYPNPTKYVDVSHSGFNSFHVFNGVNLEYLDVSYNPLNYNVPWNDLTKSYNNSLDVTYCPNIKTVLANDCSALPMVRAYNRDALTTLDLTNDPLLKTVYAQDNAELPSITGLSTLTGLETLFAYNNPQFGGINVSNNRALKNLWVSNINANSIDVSKNAALEKLRVYDNSLEALNVASNPALTWLDFARNSIEDIDLRNNTALQYFNCSNSEETLNDLSLTQNNHNGAEGDSEKPASGTAKASNGGNNLSDLVFHGTAIADVRANYNDLHRISGSFGNLTNIEFAHNHINGIDLSAATNLNADKIVDEDNGRAITAECAKFIQHGTSDEVTLYYFQLANIRGQQLTGKTSTDSKDATRYLGEDGFELGKIAQWDGTNSAHFVPTTAGIMPRGITVDPSNMDSYLGGDVEGDIVVLKEDVQNPGEGRATYSYNNGVSESTFYLDWSSDGTVTGIDAIDVAQGLSVASSYGGMTIAGADGTVIGVYDMSGRQVASETISGGKATITGLTPGIYVVNGQKVVVK